jgi:hypothetical protein
MVACAMNIYLELTREFNAGETRAILSSGQAVVLHRLAVMSKDGDWILRENPEALGCVIGVLERRNARYRFGAPLDARWMRGGWSSHFEFRSGALRARTDFETRPPRLTASDLSGLWREQAKNEMPVVDPRRLAELKKTNREKDYAVIGELARLVESPREQLLLSRSARDLMMLARANPDLARQLVPLRPLLAATGDSVEAVEVALDAERRELIHANERRLRRYMASAEAWAERWPSVEAAIEGMPLRQAHETIVARAEGLLPFEPGPEAVI